MTRKCVMPHTRVPVLLPFQTLELCSPKRPLGSGNCAVILPFLMSLAVE